jgi:hypothetical protein
LIKTLHVYDHVHEHVHVDVDVDVHVVVNVDVDGDFPVKHLGLQGRARSRGSEANGEGPVQFY